MFCLPCALFSFETGNDKKTFLRGPRFYKWHKIGEKIGEHIAGGYHSNNIAKADLFKTNYETPQEALPYRFDKTLDDRVQQNKAILKWVITVIILCGKKCDPLRGQREDISNTQINLEISLPF